MSFWCKIIGHSYEGCRCRRCGAQRDTGHPFTAVEGKCLRECPICGKTEKVPHQWHHCVCQVCGKVRDEDHDWMYTTECEAVCRVCGKEMQEHLWQPVDRGVDKCRTCGKTHRLTAEEIARRDEEYSDD